MTEPHSLTIDQITELAQRIEANQHWLRPPDPFYVTPDEWLTLCDFTGWPIVARSGVELFGLRVAVDAGQAREQREALDRNVNELLPPATPAEAVAGPHPIKTRSQRANELEAHLRAVSERGNWMAANLLRRLENAADREAEAARIVEDIEALVRAMARAWRKLVQGVSRLVSQMNVKVAVESPRHDTIAAHIVQQQATPARHRA